MTYTTPTPTWSERYNLAYEEHSAKAKSTGDVNLLNRRTQARVQLLHNDSPEATAMLVALTDEAMQRGLL